MSDVLSSFDEAALDSLFLKHYGIPRRSGRFPWGSGENPFQRSGDTLAFFQELSERGKLLMASPRFHCCLLSLA